MVYQMRSVLLSFHKKMSGKDKESSYEWLMKTDPERVHNMLYYNERLS